jgi:hypothetical protein
LFEAHATIIIDGEPAGSAPFAVRRATCTIIGLPIVHGFGGTARLTIGDDAPDATYSSNSLFMCIQSKATISARPNQSRKSIDFTFIIR